ncbi:sigma factor [Sediminicoccus sp. BL-A-41-H5]|uniref:sigma factor n=1 Tax=Sediminicoccus sp. BL-A-41-H5 TaxID=3421106 RepID=UPI003D6744C7
MFVQYQNQGADSRLWDDVHTKLALAAATHRAVRWARRGRRHQADCDDLRQDILLAILERAEHFDPKQAAWSTFVSLLARHVVGDRLRADAKARKTEPVQVDLAALSSVSQLTSVTLPEAGDDELSSVLRIDLDQAAAVLPAQARETLALLIMSQGDIAAAQRASTRSSSAFYRDLADLRLWLRAAGLARASRCRGKNRCLDQ